MGHSMAYNEQHRKATLVHIVFLTHTDGFDHGLNKTLSPVSSAPQHVCLCDTNGKLQCDNILYIFPNILFIMVKHSHY